MNLLTMNGAENSIYDSIIIALRELWLTPDEMSKAEKFFNFAEEMDLSLLDGIKPREVKSAAKSNNLPSLFSKLCNDYHDRKYSDRLILFLDAVAGNTFVTKVLYYSYSVMNGDKNNYFVKAFLHAYESVYSQDEAQMKFLALVAFLDKNNVGFCQALKTAANQSPDLLLGAAKYCYAEDQMDQFKLYSLALGYSKPEQNGIIQAISNLFKDRIIPKSEINQALDFVLNFCHALNTAGDYNFEIVSISLFMAAGHSNQVLNSLKSILKGREAKFMKMILTHVPINCFENNREYIPELLGLDENSPTVTKCIRVLVDDLWKNNGFNEGSDEIHANQNSKSLLELFAKKYPQNYIYLMRSVELLSATAFHKVFICTFYQYLYKILEKNNLKAISEHQMEYQKDVLNIAVKTERLLSRTAQDEIEKYLTLQEDISVLAPYFDQLNDPKNYSSGGCRHDAYMIQAMEKMPQYQSKYIALKVLQGRMSAFTDRIRFGGDHQKQLKALDVLIDSMAEEKIPAARRFDVYEWLHDSLYDDTLKRSTEETILENMEKRAEFFDSDYAETCPKGGVLTRKLYVKYLNHNNKDGSKKDQLLAMCADASKEVRQATTEVFAEHKEYESDIIALLSAKKQAVRETAVNILAVWGAENYREILTQAADNEKSAKLADRIRDMLALTAVSGEAEDGKIFVAATFVNDITKGNRINKISWLYHTPNSPVHFLNGDLAEDKYLQAILLCYSSMSSFGVSNEAEILAKELKTDELERYAAEIFSKWHSDGAESKKKWVINFAAVHGGENMIETILHCIKDWAENMRGAIAAEAVKALAMNGSSQALMAIDNLAHKFKQKQVKKAAIEAIDSAAEALGITADELGDRIVPNLGFDETMQRIFDYGPRKFKVYINTALELEVYDENDKKLKNMPAPGKKDDEELAKASNTEFKAMKKQLKNIIAIQKLRLETALLADRRWSKTAWEELFVKNPIMHSFAIGLIWTAYEEEKTIQTFRYMEDGSFNTSEEEEFELSENYTIGLAHPIDMDEELLETWKEQLSDYEITQPIEQLERKIYRIEEKEIGQIDLLRFAGRKMNGMTLLGRTSKFGWYKGSIQDAGGFYQFYREDITKRIRHTDDRITLLGNAVELHFSGMYVGGEDMEVTIEKVRFYQPGTVQRGSYCYDEVDNQKAIKLDQINPRYFSEIINQLESITKTSEEK